MDGNKRDDGGPAFPVLVEGALGFVMRADVGGMSLRDYFAGQALAGMFANQRTSPNNAGTAVTAAYMAADAMLAERKR